MFEIRIDGVIGKGEGEISAAMVRAMLPEDQTQPIVVKLHTEGGNVFEGFAIYDLFANYAGPKKAVVESVAFSIGSFIPMAFDDVEITPNGYMMLHNPYVQIEGDDEALLTNAALLQDIKNKMIAAYAAKAGKSVDEVTAVLKQETYFNASDAVAFGLANQITQQAVPLSRPLASQSKMPHGVVAALFGAAAGGNKHSQSKEKSKMSEVTRVAASLKQIKAAFPKAKNDFIVRCMEKEMTIEEVNATAMEEMMEENETLSAKVKAMEDELAALKAAKAEMPKEEVPTAKTGGVAPVARGVAGGVTASAKVKWNEAINEYVAKGMTRQQAVVAVNRVNPGLRSQLLAEAKQ